MWPEPPLVPTGLPPAVAARCGITEDEWTRMLLDLLPVGWAWPREPETTIMRFWSAVAIEPTRIQARDCDLLAESYPCGATELLPEWEAAVGIPNECTELVQWTVAERQAFVCAWLAIHGGSSRDYFIALFASFGFTVTIVEHFPYRAGQAQAGCASSMADCQFWWTVVIHDVPVTIRYAGCTAAGEAACGTAASAMLAFAQCLLNLFAPAHTIVTVSYVPAEP